jgi:hypothetical protein
MQLSVSLAAHECSPQPRVCPHAYRVACALHHPLPLCPPAHSCRPPTDTQTTDMPRRGERLDVKQSLDLLADAVSIASAADIGRWDFGQRNS